MPNVNNFIKVQLTRQSKAIPQRGFGSALLLSFESAPESFIGDVRRYTKEGYATDFTLSTSAIRQALDNHFSQSNLPEQVFVGFVGAEETETQALDRILESEEGFYAVVPVGTTDTAKLLNVGKWVESKDRMCLIQDAGEEIKDVTNETDIASLCKASNLSRTSVWFSASTTEWINSAVAGKLLPTITGQVTWSYKSLSGITTQNLSDTAIGVIQGKSANVYISVASQSITNKGVTSDGEFIDIIRQSDWITTRIQEEVFATLVRHDKIPFTDAGADILESAATSILQQAIVQGILKSRFEISKQSVSDIPVNDRANRRFPSIIIKGEFTGAIHTIGYSLTISV